MVSFLNSLVRDVRSSIEELLRQHDLVYEAVPLEWEQGIPLGNGIIRVFPAIPDT